MLRLDRVIKPWKDAAALCDHINLYGFWNETAFLTKSGISAWCCVSRAWTTRASIVGNRSTQ